MAQVINNVADLQLAVGEHRVRLQNGSEVFAKYEKKISEIDRRTTPTPPSVFKIASITLAFFMAAAGALWALATMLRDRPTLDQIERVMDKQSAQHELGGHQAIKADITSIQGQLGEQRALINNATGKLDTLLIRIPASTKRRTD